MSFLRSLRLPSRSAFTSSLPSFHTSSLSKSSSFHVRVRHHSSGCGGFHCSSTVHSAAKDTSATTSSSSPSSSASSSASSSSDAYLRYNPLHPSSNEGYDDHHHAHSELRHLLENNRQWAANMKEQYPNFFENLSNQQSPKYMWIGCSDSRVPSTEITGLMPGEMFVHRNVANCVVHADLNLLSVLQIAVEVLKVEHIIVCGHYGCAGINSALRSQSIGLADNWVRNIRDVAEKYHPQLSRISDSKSRADLLTEMNVRQQVENVCHTTIVQQAWQRGRPLHVHGWVYGVHNGLIKNLVDPSIKGMSQISRIFQVDYSK